MGVSVLEGHPTGPFQTGSSSFSLIAGHVWSQETDATSSASPPPGPPPRQFRSPPLTPLPPLTPPPPHRKRTPQARRPAPPRLPQAPLPMAGSREPVHDRLRHRAGTCVRISLLLALLGLLYRFRQFRRLTRMAPGRGKYRPEAVLGLQHENRPVLASLFPGPARPKSGTHPVMRTVSLVFHILLFLVPLLFRPTTSSWPGDSTRVCPPSRARSLTGSLSS